MKSIRFKLLYPIMLCFFTLSSSQSFALISAQAMMGFPNMTYTPYHATNEEIKLSGGSSLSLSAYVDPIPLVPVGFGVSFLTLSDAKGEDSNGKSYSVTDATVDMHLLAWLPFVSVIIGVTPYVKLGLVVQGATKVTTPAGVSLGGVDLSSPLEVPYTHSGETRMALGFRYSVLPLIKITGEYSMRGEAEMKTLSLSESGVSIGEGEKGKLKGNIFYIGVEAGI